MNCGAKVPIVPPMPKKEKRKIKKNKGKRSKVKIVIPVFTVLILAVLSFMIFGGDLVPEKLRSLKGYSYLTGMVKEKLPAPAELPFDLPGKFPFDFSFELPFELPKLGSLLPGGGTPEEKESRENKTAETADKDSEDNKEQDKESVEAIAAGVADNVIISEQSLYADISPDWKRIKVEVLEHQTDTGAGTDTIVVYLELENSYVNMTGAREITYTYDGHAGKWEAGPASKILCLSMDPVSVRL